MYKDCHKEGTDWCDLGKMTQCERVKRRSCNAERLTTCQHSRDWSQTESHNKEKCRNSTNRWQPIWCVKKQAQLSLKSAYSNCVFSSSSSNRDHVMVKDLFLCMYMHTFWYEAILLRMDEWKNVGLMLYSVNIQYETLFNMRCCMFSEMKSLYSSHNNCNQVQRYF